MMERIGIQLEEAAGLIAEHIQPVRDVATVELAEAAGRILAREYYSDMDNPPFDRSPLDGYAFRSQDVAQAREEADRKFRSRFPDRPGHEGTMNYSFCYTKERWNQMDPEHTWTGWKLYEVIE